MKTNYLQQLQYARTINQRLQKVKSPETKGAFGSYQKTDYYDQEVALKFLPRGIRERAKALALTEACFSCVNPKAE